VATRPRVLYLSQSLPYPPHTGAAARIFNILLQLEKAYDVDLVAFYRVKHQPDRHAVGAAWEALKRLGDFVAEPTPIPNEHSALRKLWDHARSLLSGRVYTYYAHESRLFARRLRDALGAHMPDLVHVEGRDLHRSLRNLPSVPIACTHQDIESDLLRRRAHRLTNIAARHYFLLQADRVERLERELCPQFALNVMMSEVDARKLRALAPGAVTVVVPNGTDTDYFQPNGTTPLPGRVTFVGPTASHPNRDALEFLLQDIWPQVLAVDRAASLQLIGRSTPADQARYSLEPGVNAVGHVADLRPLLAEAACCVVPTRIGGGTRLKILDAWAMGKAVVSTSIGCEGLDAVDGENILIRDTPAAFAAAVLAVLGNAQLRERLERNGRRTATQSYSWNSVGQHLRAAYDQLIGPRSSRADTNVVANDAGV